MFRLDGKVALVTGCGTLGEGWGNGKAISVALARQGASIFGSDLNLEAAQQTKKIIEDEGGVAHVITADATQADEVKKLVDACMAQYGRIDILINNVGRSEPGDPVSMSEQTWVWKKQVSIADIRQAKFIYLPALSWLIAPRLVVRTGPIMTVFYTAHPDVQRAFAALMLGR